MLMVRSETEFQEGFFADIGQLRIRRVRVVARTNLLDSACDTVAKEPVRLVCSRKTDTAAKVQTADALEEQRQVLKTLRVRLAL